MRNEKGQFKKDNSPHNKGIKKRTNTGRTHFKKGQVSWNKGTKDVVKAWNKGTKGLCKPNSGSFQKGQNAGELSPFWIRDRTKIKMSDRYKEDANYKVWRKEVYKRDRWKCRIANSDCKGRIEAHHILNWVHYPELRYIINNGITLCHAHHPRGRKKEAELSPYLQQLVAEIK